MGKIFEAQIRVRRKKLPPRSAAALTRLETYDWILFTSKHAVAFFDRELRARHVTLPKRPRIAAVGPNTAEALRTLKLSVHTVSKKITANDLLKKLRSVEGKSILFPRSAIAPHDAVSTLRGRGARVTVLLLYTTEAAPLSKIDKYALLQGACSKILFKSPSGVEGLMGQLSPAERRVVQKIPALCIGPTTAAAARAADFKKVSYDIL